MSTKKYIGIDIGLKGGIVIQEDNKIEIHQMPVVGKILFIPGIMNIFNTISTDSHVVFENLGVIYGSGKTTAFSMGYQLGVIEALCASYKIPYSKVNAKEWQKEMFKGVQELTLPPSKNSLKGKRDTKGMALVAVNRLFPSLNLIQGRQTKPHDGIVDALLMSEYAKRINL